MKASIQLVKCFINEKLDGDIDALKNFNFMELENNAADNKKYGCSGRNFDCDDTNLARAIYLVVWKDKLPNLTPESIKDGKKYRGETLNTAKTFFGYKPENNEIPYWRATKFAAPDDVIADIEKFRMKFLTLGNFMLLPNYPLKGPKKTINMYRSWGKWYDFFDKFLFELNKCFKNDQDKDEDLMHLINENSHYFNYFNNDIQKLSKTNFLEPYFKEDGAINSLPFSCDYPMTCDYIKNPTDEQKQMYVKNAKSYLSYATNVIDYRANKMIKVIKSKL